MTGLPEFGQDLKPECVCRVPRPCPGPGPLQDGCQALHATVEVVGVCLKRKEKNQNSQIPSGPEIFCPCTVFSPGLRSSLLPRTAAFILLQCWSCKYRRVRGGAPGSRRFSSRRKFCADVLSVHSPSQLPPGPGKELEDSRGETPFLDLEYLRAVTPAAAARDQQWQASPWGLGETAELEAAVTDMSWEKRTLPGPSVTSVHL